MKKYNVVVSHVDSRSLSDEEIEKISVKLKSFYVAKYIDSVHVIRNNVHVFIDCWYKDLNSAQCKVLIKRSKTGGYKAKKLEQESEELELMY